MATTYQDSMKREDMEYFDSEFMQRIDEMGKEIEALKETVKIKIGCQEPEIRDTLEVCKMLEMRVHQFKRLKLIFEDLESSYGSLANKFAKSREDNKPLDDVDKCYEKKF